MKKVKWKVSKLVIKAISSKMQLIVVIKLSEVQCALKLYA